MSSDYHGRIREIVAAVRHLPVASVSLDSSLEELGVDSLEGLSIVLALEDEFHIEIPDEYLQRTRSIRELADQLLGLLPPNAVAWSGNS
jgi:acyl carrier protein